MQYQRTGIEGCKILIKILRMKMVQPIHRHGGNITFYIEGIGSEGGGQVLFVSGQECVAGFCEHINVLSTVITGGKFTGHLWDSRFNKNAAPQRRSLQPSPPSLSSSSPLFDTPAHSFSLNTLVMCLFSQDMQHQSTAFTISVLFTHSTFFLSLNVLLQSVYSQPRNPIRQSQVTTGETFPTDV